MSAVMNERPARRERTMAYFQVADLAQRILASATVLNVMPRSPSNLWLVEKAEADIRLYTMKLLEGLGDE